MTELDLLRAQEAEGKRLLRDQMELTNKITMEAIELRAQVEAQRDEISHHETTLSMQEVAIYKLRGKVEELTRQRDEAMKDADWLRGHYEWAFNGWESCKAHCDYINDQIEELTAAIQGSKKP